MAVTLAYKPPDRATPGIELAGTGSLGWPTASFAPSGKGVDCQGACTLWRRRLGTAA